MQKSREAFHLRELDVDDLIVMQNLLRGKSGTQISKILGITPPAVSHRRKKYEEIFPGFYDRGKHGLRILSPKGKDVCKRMEKALFIMLDDEQKKSVA